MVCIDLCIIEGHSAELPFVFGTVSLANMSNITFSENEKILSNSMMQYWGNFVKYGNPNGDFTEKVKSVKQIFHHNHNYHKFITIHCTL